MESHLTDMWTLVINSQVKSNFFILFKSPNQKQAIWHAY